MLKCHIKHRLEFDAFFFFFFFSFANVCFKCLLQSKCEPEKPMFQFLEVKLSIYLNRRVFVLYKLNVQVGT